MTHSIAVRKPRAVLAFQIVAWLVTVVLAVGILRFLLVLPQVAAIGLLPLEYWVGLFGRTVGVGILLFTLIALRKRRIAARFTGAIVIAGLLAAYINQVFINPTPPILPRLQYDNPAFGYTVERILNVLFSALLVYWGYAYAFSSKAKVFFYGQVAA